MALTDSTLFYKSNPNVHVIVTYSKKEKLDDLVISFLNEGLKIEQLCIYASVNLDDSIIKKLSSKLTDYEENIKNENLLVIDLKPHISSVLDNNLEPFEELKKSVLSNISQRTQKHVRFYGDLAGYLFENKHFEESVLVEEWCQDSPFEGTIICPYQNSILDASPLEQKNRIVNSHDNIVLC